MRAGQERPIPSPASTRNASGPGETNTEDVDARLSEGLLTVKVPEAEPAKPRRIRITAGE